MRGSMPTEKITSGLGLYGTTCVLFANGQPLWQGRQHGVLDDRVLKVVKWRRRHEGLLGELLHAWKIDTAHLSAAQLTASVDHVTWVWFTRGHPGPIESRKL